MEALEREEKIIRFEDILERMASYTQGQDLDVLKRVYVFSGVVHQGQTRQSGEPYLVHPLQVAYILTALKMDVACVATGLLHDTVEDTHTTVEKVEELFGKEIAGLVDGVTKLSRMTFEKKEDREAENFRKMILAMSKDIRVILVKLADRLHNMRTLGYLDPVRKKKIARETLDIYAPLAHRLGIGWLKIELEDLAFMHLEPERYNWIKDRVSREREAWDKYIRNVTGIIGEKLKENGIEAEVTGRLKHLWSINKKMEDQDVEFENIHDIIAFRVIVKTVKDCYGSLGVIHAGWKPVPGRFKDYIALPKLNMYQSLHTTVVGPFGVRMEVQIRTEEMHGVAEYGIAAHWKYKEGKSSDETKDEKRFAWLRQLLEWQKDLKDSDEFMESLKAGLFPEEVFVFTPKGDIKQFPTGATPIDFAFAIHTDVGSRCSGAKVNGRIVPLRTKLKNGDVVEIITTQTHTPSKDWLKFVVTSRAKTKIRQWIKTEERAKSIVLGRDLLEKEFAKHGLEYGKYLKGGDIERIAKENFGLQGVESLLASAGYGKISAHQILGKILPPEKLAPSKFSIKRVLEKLGVSPGKARSPVIVSGEGDILIKFARCCNPLPGDEIAGFITRGQGVAVHSKGCTNLINIDRERVIDVAWDSSAKTTRPVKISVIFRNEKGVLAEMTNAIKAADANISSAEIKTAQDNRATCTFEVEVNDLAHLKTVISSLQKIKKVLRVERVKSDISRDAEYEGTA